MAQNTIQSKSPSKVRRFFVGVGSVLLLSSALPAWGWSQGWDWDEDFTGPNPPPVDCSIDAAPECDQLWT